MKRRFEICSDIDECLQRLKLKPNEKYAVAVTRTHAEQSKLFALDKIYCFDREENLQNYSISLNIRKGFEYMTEVNEIIKRTLEAGLIKSWENDGQPVSNSVKLSKHLDDFTVSSIPRLNNATLFAIGSTIALLIISVEVVVSQRIEALNRYNLNMFIHKLLNARWQWVYGRHFLNYPSIGKHRRESRENRYR